MDAVAGNTIVDECYTHVKLNGKLLPGHTFVSKPGRLPCKAIIHAVGPMWRGGQHHENDELYVAVMNALTDAAERGFQTIAIPAISAGSFGFPVDQAAEIILSASRDYLTDQSGTRLQQVHIVDNDPEVVRRFETVLKSLTVPSIADEEHPSPSGRRVMRSHKDGEVMQNASGEL